MPVPCGTNNCNVRAVGLYQDVLTGHGNSQEESEVAHAKCWFNPDANPIRPRKSLGINLDIDIQEATASQPHQKNTTVQQPTSPPS
eukprot:15333232-Ditylum_brightwellii.AAC.2